MNDRRRLGPKGTGGDKTRDKPESSIRAWKNMEYALQEVKDIEQLEERWSREAGEGEFSKVEKSYTDREENKQQVRGTKTGSPYTGKQRIEAMLITRGNPNIAHQPSHPTGERHRVPQFHGSWHEPWLETTTRELEDGPTYQLLIGEVL
ncbi:hypothetical protein NDU88_004252 [Pleurodeles waltl]|uniref:Uncharacterized protein n=1 Tax=Pleurodeles waltl TaxID=8319 RepID=A0AAV7KYX4_PLEWA|nr:hypothetical protein NDU88_004252 [Pleurodeles waltl]